MRECTHTRLVLLPHKAERQRCRHCHLTIASDELDAGYCPECYETQGKKHYDFEAVAVSETEVTKYRCEQCGITIEC